MGIYMRKEGKQEAQLMLRNLRDAIHPEGKVVATVWLRYRPTVCGGINVRQAAGSYSTTIVQH